VQALRAHLAATGADPAGEYCDDGCSGARLDRPGLDALRDAAEAGLFEVVWCLSPDRLARSYAYQGWDRNTSERGHGATRHGPELLQLQRAAK
jgi:DNA invertase Pin-like site-specific DNA recombinase